MSRLRWALVASIMLVGGTLAACGDDETSTTLPPSGTGGVAGFAGTAGFGGGLGGFAGTGGFGTGGIGTGGLGGFAGGIATGGIGGMGGTGGIGTGGIGTGGIGTGGIGTGGIGTGGIGTGGIGTGGIGTGGTGTGGAPGCPNCAVFPAGACDDCVKSSCCSICESFTTNPDAWNIMQCTLGCTDPACYNNCISSFPAGTNDFNALLGTGGCVETNCSLECGSTTTGCGLTFGNPTCNACFESNCCTQGTACDNDAQCVPYVDCLITCNGDPTCETGCGTTYPSGMNSWNSLEQCLNANCLTECASGSGCGVTTGNPTCDSCLDTNCCAQGTACGAEPDCIPYASCMGGCAGNAACEAQCAVDHPNGPAVWNPLEQCLTNNCDQECGGGGCGVTFPTLPQCDTCLGTNCCDEGLTCSADLDCIPYQNCVVACAGDTACEAGCGTTYPNGPASWGQLETCLTASCSTECFSAGCGVTFNDPDCDTCLGTNCCAEGTACGNEPDCIPYQNCLVQCLGDPGCETQCGVDYPGGQASWDPLETCLLNSCNTECFAP